MNAQRQDHTNVDPPWDPSRVRVALATARHNASRGGHRLRLSRADREDLHQDILLAIVARSRHFDPKRGAWSTFTNVLARHVLADHVRAQRAASGLEFVLADPDEFAAGSSATQQDRTDATLSLALRRVADELPPEPRATLRLLGTTGDVADARRSSPHSPAGFYRVLGDVRFWLRAAGMRPSRGVPRRSVGARV